MKKSLLCSLSLLVTCAARPRGTLDICQKHWGPRESNLPKWDTKLYIDAPRGIPAGKKCAISLVAHDMLQDTVVELQGLPATGSFNMHLQNIYKKVEKSGLSKFVNPNHFVLSKLPYDPSVANGLNERFKLDAGFRLELIITVSGKDGQAVEAHDVPLYTVKRQIE